MDDETRMQQENDAIDLMRHVASEKGLFQLREGDGRLASIDRLIPDFYAIFTSNAKLAYMEKWGAIETIIVIAPMAVVLLVVLASLSSQVAQIALDVLVSLTVNCSHIWQHGFHLSQESPESLEGGGVAHRLLNRPLRLLRWLDGTDRWVARAWGVMRLSQPDNRTERLRHLASSMKRMREERTVLQKRRSILKEGPPDNH